ncbi:MAG: type III-B CRISPR-associated protein Cas10/Cmr2 [Roseiflexaceae bacterium]
MRYLLLVSIGPVQEFIASARRSRDLWFGSWMLSELSKTVAHEIDHAKGTLIFPAPASPDTYLHAGGSLRESIGLRRAQWPIRLLTTRPIC